MAILIILALGLVAYLLIKLRVETFSSLGADAEQAWRQLAQAVHSRHEGIERYIELAGGRLGDAHVLLVEAMRARSRVREDVDGRNVRAFAADERHLRAQLERLVQTLAAPDAPDAEADRFAAWLRHMESVLDQLADAYDRRAVTFNTRISRGVDFALATLFSLEPRETLEMGKAPAEKTADSDDDDGAAADKWTSLLRR